MLVAELFDQNEVAGLVQAALDETVALVPLAAGPSSPGAFTLLLRAPGMAEPLMLRAELAGEEMGGMYPLLLLRPASERHVQRLQTFVRSTGYAAERSPSSVPKTISAVRESQRPAEEPPKPVEHEADAMIGRTLGNGRYEIQALLGVGGMGRVYKARHLALDKDIAVKLLHAKLCNDPDFAARFQREALAASRLDHPNVMRVVDFGQEDDGLLYIAMELLLGQNLGHAVKDMPLERSLQIVIRVCTALTAAHGQGIVHRDIKPENIVINPREDEDGSAVDDVKVCDFGLAKINDARGSSVAPEAPRGPLERRKARETALGSVQGTPEYMSPEQSRGDQIDARTDIYACGVILYELVTGDVPFSGEDANRILIRHMLEEPAPPSSRKPGIDPRLDAIILKALAKERENRHQTARELRDELRALLSSMGGAATPLAAGTLEISLPELSEPPAALGPPATLSERPRTHSLPSGPPEGSRRPSTSMPDAAELERRAERGVSALKTDPERVFLAFEQIQDLTQFEQEMRTLARAVDLLTQQNEIVVVGGVARRIRMWAGSAAPGPMSRDAIAARTLQVISTRRLLDLSARELLSGPAAAREAALEILSLAGNAGADALCKARSAIGVDERERPRFVAALRTLAPQGLAAIATALQNISLTDKQADPAVAEDLLRAVPEKHDLALGERLARFLDHDSPAIRRVAARLVPLLWGERARPRLLGLLDDPEEGVVMVALAGLATIGGVDREMVGRIEQLLQNDGMSAEVHAAALAALAKVEDSARVSATTVLFRTIEPRTRSIVGVLRGVPQESPLVIATAASALLKIGGQGGRKAVEKRLAVSRGEVRERLQRLLGG